MYTWNAARALAVPDAAAWGVEPDADDDAVAFALAAVFVLPPPQPERTMTAAVAALNVARMDLHFTALIVGATQARIGLALHIRGDFAADSQPTLSPDRGRRCSGLATRAPACPRYQPGRVR